MDNSKWYDIQRLRHIVFKLVLPIYLWSIGYKTIDEYIEAILIDEEMSGRIKILTD